MYIQQGKELTKEEIMKAVTEKAKKEKIILEDYEVEEIASRLKTVNDLLKDNFNIKTRKRAIFAICEKAASVSYYSIYYIHDNSLCRLWLYDFMKAVGAKKTRDKRLRIPYYCFASKAVGMSRVLAATDKLFKFLHDIGGYYAQIDCLN